MGHVAGALCRGCDYKERYTVGAGMANFRTVSIFPACCNQCHRVSDVDFKKKPLRCKRCDSTDVTPFWDVSLSKGDGKDTTDSWLDMKLTDGHYKCPQCGEFKLQFGGAGGGTFMMFD